MDKKLITIIFLAALIPIIFITFTILTPNIEKSPTASVIETCNTLEFNNEEATNIVFFSEEEQAEEYKNFFQQTSPFTNYKNAFNFYYINSYKPKCEMYKGIAILCHSKELVKKASSCPNDFSIVLKEEPKNIRSSAYQNVLSINTNHNPTVLTHEFGHAFANLAEEYTTAKIPRGSENCQSSCIKFQGETDGCFEGCSKTNYHRSIENGVMRTLSSNDFGTFNTNIITNLIKEKSPSAITGQTINENQDCSSQNYYLIEATLNENQINLTEKTLETGCLGNNGAGNFQYQIKTSQNQVLTENNFNPELIFTEAPGENQIDGEVFISDKPFLLKIPAIKNAESLTISENEQELAIISKDGNELANIRLNNIGNQPCKL
tara:strand:- start:5568 stop:6701 length:1134 start_codon:yes stop_codon:yes gene_type:complete